MKNTLKKIYDTREEFDILNKPTYHFMTNPFYQVNKYISNIDEGLTKNFRENLNDLKIELETNPLYKSSYDYTTNTLYCKNLKTDVFALLHMASNDKDKKYTGIISSGEIGYGLDNGLTEMFAVDINHENFIHPLEATIAKSLYMIDPKIVTFSYFTNDGNSLLLLNKNIKELMVNIDNYYNNYIKLIFLNKELFARKYRKLRSSNQNKELKELESEIYYLERINFENAYKSFKILINIINESKLSLEEKQDLFTRLYNEFDILFGDEQFSYLNELANEFKTNNYTKKRVK